MRTRPHLHRAVGQSEQHRVSGAHPLLDVGHVDGDAAPGHARDLVGALVLLLAVVLHLDATHEQPFSTARQRNVADRHQPDKQQPSWKFPVTANSDLTSRDRVSSVTNAKCVDRHW